MTTVAGSGIQEFDDILQKHKPEIGRLKLKMRHASGAEKSNAARDLRGIFGRVVTEARSQIGLRDGNQDHDSGRELQDKRAIAHISDELEGLSDLLGSDSTDVLLGGDHLPKLSEIRWINDIGPDRREVVLHDGNRIIVDNDINQKAFFGLSTDFENQLRKVSADQAPHRLLEQGYGLIGRNELLDVVDLVAGTKPDTVPKVEKKGDHIIALSFTDKDGKEHKYFAHDGHSPDAYQWFHAFAQWVQVPAVREGLRTPKLDEPKPSHEDDRPKPEDVAAGGYELIEDDLLQNVNVVYNKYESERIKEPPSEALKKNKQYKNKKVKLELPMFFDGKGRTVGQWSRPEEFPGYMRFHYTDEKGNLKKYYIDETKTPNQYKKAVHMAEHVRAVEEAQGMGWSIWDTKNFKTGESQLREIENHFQNEELGIIGIKFYDKDAVRDNELGFNYGNGSLNYNAQYHAGEYIIFSKERTPEAYDVIRKYIKGTVDLGYGMNGNDHSNDWLNAMYAPDHWTDYNGDGKKGTLKLEDVKN